MDKLPVALWMVGIFAICEYAAQKRKDRTKKEGEPSPAPLIITIIGILLLWPW